MLPPRTAWSRLAMFGCSLLAAGYVTGFYLSSADGALLSAQIAEQRIDRLSSYELGALVAGVIVSALVLSAVLAAVPQGVQDSRSYWRVTRLLRTWHRRRRDHLRLQWLRLRRRVEADIALRGPVWWSGTPNDQAERTIRVDRMAETLAVRYPTDDALVQATVVGNVLAAARQRIEDVYALDVLLSWPRLYPVLSRRMRRAAAMQRAALDASVAAWALALVVLCAVLPANLVWDKYDVHAWAAPAAVVITARMAAVRAAVRYATTVRVAFDLHRFDLYEALHLRAPADLDEEQETNRALSRQWHPYGAARVRHPARTGGVPRVPSAGPDEAWWHLPDGDVTLGRGTAAPGRTTPADDADDAWWVAEEDDEGSAFRAGTPDLPPPPSVPGAQGPVWTRPPSGDEHGAQPVPGPPAEGEAGPDGDEAQPSSTEAEQAAQKTEEEIQNLASAARVGATLAAGGTIAAGVSGGVVATGGLGTVAGGVILTAVATWLSLQKSKNAPPVPDTDESPLPALGYEHRDTGPSLRIEDSSLRKALDPPAPVAFRGAVAVTMEDAVRAEVVDGEPEWRLWPGRPASLVVLLALGAMEQSAPQALLDDAPGIADEMLVVAGRSAGVVELDVVLDAPFLTVTPGRHTVRLRQGTDGGPGGTRCRHTSALMAQEPGTYDIRVAVYASGRLVQALPVTVVVEDGDAPDPSGFLRGVV
ncbi:hypothetical protein ABZ759_23765 [Streptomyces sp. NPDC047860]|uniref:hypothetical protein n=1 Tax=Streptomyces sp. NPDC047860 TaxID=3155743 RepID=UPI00341002D3